MPVTGLNDDWLQALMANYGASAPGASLGYPSLGVSPAEAPGTPPRPAAGAVGYGALPGLPPSLTSPGPSMGYPAMGQPSAASPGPAQGLSLTSNPIANWLRNNVSIGAPNFANISPDAVRDFNRARSAIGGVFAGAPGPPPIGFGNAAGTPISPPAGPTTAPPAKRTDAAYGPYDDPNAPDPIGDYVSRVGNYPSWPTPTAATQSPVSVATAPRGVKRTDAAYGPYNAPGAGAPTGNPSQTPRPPRSSNRFGTFQYQVAGSPGVGGGAPGGPLSRAPIYTALNLFGRG